MLRQYCPWCKQLVSMTSADQIKCVNGRGMFKTEIYAHRSCYEREVKHNEKWYEFKNHS